MATLLYGPKDTAKAGERIEVMAQVGSEIITCAYTSGEG